MSPEKADQLYKTALHNIEEERKLNSQADVDTDADTDANADANATASALTNYDQLCLQQGRDYFSKYCRHQEQRGVPVIVLRNDFIAIVNEIECVTCGCESLGGIDRWFTWLPYIIGKLVPMCKFCNHGKGNDRPEDFIQLCRDIESVWKSPEQRQRLEKWQKEMVENPNETPTAISPDDYFGFPDTVTEENW